MLSNYFLARHATLELCTLVQKHEYVSHNEEDIVQRYCQHNCVVKRGVKMKKVIDRIL